MQRKVPIVFTNICMNVCMFFIFQLLLPGYVKSSETQNNNHNNVDDIVISQYKDLIFNFLNYLPVQLN